MTRRNRFHAKAEATLAQMLRNWVTSQPEKLGEVFSGEVGCILTQNPDTNVGIDVAWFSAETLSRQTDATTMIEGAPVLAIEILSPSDRLSDVVVKVDVYLDAGVERVWIVDPHFKTITVHRATDPPVLFNIAQTLTDDTRLPGLALRVAEIFS